MVFFITKQVWHNILNIEKFANAKWDTIKRTPLTQGICVSSYETTSSEDSSGEEDQDAVEEVDSSEPELEQGQESGTAQEEAGEQGDGVQAEGSKEPDAAQAAMSPLEEQPVRWDGGPWWNEGVGVIAFLIANNE